MTRPQLVLSTLLAQRSSRSRVPAIPAAFTTFLSQQSFTTHPIQLSSRQICSQSLSTSHRASRSRNQLKTNNLSSKKRHYSAKIATEIVHEPDSTIELIRRVMLGPIPTRLPSLNNSELESEVINPGNSGNSEAYRGSYHFEKLEFLGDRVLNLLASEICFVVGPATGKDCTWMQDKYSVATTNEFCAALALRYGMPRAKSRYTPQKPAADQFEAFVGAYYLSQGREKTNLWLAPLIYEQIMQPRLDILPLITTPPVLVPVLAVLPVPTSEPIISPLQAIPATPMTPPSPPPALPLPPINSPQPPVITTPSKSKIVKSSKSPITSPKVAAVVVKAVKLSTVPLPSPIPAPSDSSIQPLLKTELEIMKAERLAAKIAYPAISFHSYEVAAACFLNYCSAHRESLQMRDHPIGSFVVNRFANLVSVEPRRYFLLKTPGHVAAGSFSVDQKSMFKIVGVLASRGFVKIDPNLSVLYNPLTQRASVPIESTIESTEQVLEPKTISVDGQEIHLPSSIAPVSIVIDGLLSRLDESFVAGAKFEPLAPRPASPPVPAHILEHARNRPPLMIRRSLEQKSWTPPFAARVRLVESLPNEESANTSSSLWRARLKWNSTSPISIPVSPPLSTLTSSPSTPTISIDSYTAITPALETIYDIRNDESILKALTERPPIEESAEDIIDPTTAVYLASAEMGSIESTIQIPESSAASESIAEVEEREEQVPIVQENRSNSLLSMFYSKK